MLEILYAIGVGMDIEKARKWSTKATALGHASAKKVLEVITGRGYM